jgi:hypothetical protein
MEAAGSFATLIHFTKVHSHHIAEDCNPNTHCSENLRSQINRSLSAQYLFAAVATQVVCAAPFW